MQRERTVKEVAWDRCGIGQSEGPRPLSVAGRTLGEL
jgi:hypothetical protein